MVAVMVAWSRPPSSSSAGAVPVGADHSPVALAEQIGDLACTQPGCGAATGLPCDYVDRRGRACGTAWCPDHRLVIDARVYCRRHAGVVSALPVGLASSWVPMPDLENRAPSLVSWVAREVDADVRDLLLGEAGLGDGAQIVTDPVYLVFVGCDRRRAWERAWKVVDRTGWSLRVALVVEECADAEVAVRVSSRIVERLTPPWIVQRLHGAQPAVEVDAQRRKDFDRRVCGIIRKGIDRERGRDAPRAREEPSPPPTWPAATSPQLS